MHNKFKIGLLSIFVLLIISGCVSKSRYESMQQTVLTLEEEVRALTEANDKLSAYNNTVNLAKEDAVLMYLDHYEGTFSENDYYLFQMFQGGMYLLNANPETVNFIEHQMYKVSFDANLIIQNVALASGFNE
ncbi:hypothetical protein [Erysipelothrix aquatica]|uniref:hypothetical protein n=1 Tax=Erysipelothrix aquatica TaxID=2683714 RepID=UPI0013593555|nr:hypothetical protein [Erysipelothrix aquatica]